MYLINISNKYSVSLIKTPSVDIIRLIINCFELKFGAIEYIKITIK